MNAHIWDLMQTLRPHTHEAEAQVAGGPVAEGSCSNSGTPRVSQVWAAGSGHCRTGQPPGNSSPPPAADMHLHDVRAWGLPTGSHMEDDVPISTNSARQGVATRYQRHHWEVPPCPPLSSAMPHGSNVGQCDHQCHCGAREQLEALQQINRLQQTGRKRKMEVSKAPHSNISDHLSSLCPIIF